MVEIKRFFPVGFVELRRATGALQPEQVFEAQSAPPVLLLTFKVELFDRRFALESPSQVCARVP